MLGGSLGQAKSFPASSGCVTVLPSGHMAGVSYRERKAVWFEERLLRRHAGVFHLWALGVGAVISGDFFGWNFGFVAGGFAGLLIALGIITLLFIGLSFSLSELSAIA